jgi:hypothetical protein
MSLILNGDTGISAVDGTASVPALVGNDTNTGIYFPAADTIGFSEGGVQVGEFDSSANFKFNSGYGSVATAYGCRAWVNFNGTGTVAIRASGNVTSITDNNTGDYTINFTTAMPDINYSVTGAVNEGSTDNALPARIAQLRRSTPTTSSFRIGISNLSNTAFDAEYVFFQVFR